MMAKLPTLERSSTDSHSVSSFSSASSPPTHPTGYRRQLSVEQQQERVLALAFLSSLQVPEPELSEPANVLELTMSRRQSSPKEFGEQLPEVLTELNRTTSVTPSRISDQQRSTTDKDGLVSSTDEETPLSRKLATYVSGYCEIANDDERESLWRQGLIKSNLLGSRVFFSSKRRAYLCVSSLIQFNEEKERRRKRVSLDECQHHFTEANHHNLKGGVSYAHLLLPGSSNNLRTVPIAEHSRGGTSRTTLLSSVDSMPVIEQYDPSFIDDHQIRLGKHRTVVSLAGYQMSIIPFVRKNDLKEELNEQFRQKHPWIHKTITLSKLRNLKRDVLELAKELNIEHSTVALAWVYFEKLILKRAVDKRNRKLLVGVCLLIALKFNEGKVGRERLEALFQGIDQLDQKEITTPQEILTAEFQVWAALGFSLHVDLQEVYPHFNHFLSMSGTTTQEYLGEEMYAFYFRDEERPAAEDEDDTHMLSLTNIPTITEEPSDEERLYSDDNASSAT